MPLRVDGTQPAQEMQPGPLDNGLAFRSRGSSIPVFVARRPAGVASVGSAMARKRKPAPEACVGWFRQRCNARRDESPCGSAFLFR
jgi:hypothetical protein